MDSLDQVEFLMHVEDKLGFELKDKDTEACVTFGDILELVAREARHKNWKESKPL